MGLLHDPVAGALTIPYIERPVPFAGPTSPPVTAAAIAIWPPAATSPLWVCVDGLEPMGPVLARAASELGVDPGVAVLLSWAWVGIPLGARSWDAVCQFGHALRIARRPLA
eukprot:8505111-Alexandrium_andersonii.AAC.1